MVTTKKANSAELRMTSLGIASPSLVKHSVYTRPIVKFRVMLQGLSGLRKQAVRVMLTAWTTDNTNVQFFEVVEQ